MYLIQITDPATFNATTTGGGTAFDSELWLFNLDGRGVTFNDDSVGLQSTITGAFVPYAGLYYLAISRYDRDAGAFGGEIWADTPFGTERQPDGARRGEALEAWGGAAGAAGAYTITLAGAQRPRKQIVAPDNHHLAETTGVTLPGGSTAWWRGAGGRFQVIYDASHFTGAGVTGGTWIDKLLFRGEDGEGNGGGQSWAGVTVQVGRTSMTPATMGTDFAANLAAAAALSPVGVIPTVTARRSAGSFPNNYNIELDLFVAFGGWNYNPTIVAAPNLIVDVVMPAAATLPPNGAMIAMQDTTGGLTVVRGAGINAAIGAATAASVSTAPIIVALGIDGSGGAAPPIVATNESYGSACGGSPSSFFQTFRNGQAFDLARGVTLTPDSVAAPTNYTVSAGAGAFDATKVNAAPNSTGDDVVVTHALGFTHNYPGGSTTSIKPCTNGYVWVDAAATAADFTPTVAEFLGSLAGLVARHAPFWMDWHGGRNLTSHPNSGLHVLTDTSGGAGNAVCYVTWFNMAAFNSNAGGNTVYDMQMAIFEATGVVEYRYGSMPSQAQTGGDQCMVGFTRGRIGATPSVNPQSRDLSVEVPFTTSVEGATGNMLQTVAATPTLGGAQYGGRAFAGQSLTFNVSNVPAGAIIGAQLIDLVYSRPGTNIPGIHALGCGQAVSLSPTIWSTNIPLVPPTVTGLVPLAIPAGFDGAELYLQYAVLDGLLFPGPLVTQMSNALRVRIGNN
ncbi:MAG: hypothetical protein WAT39_20175 [Planctomycetota bacterium]